MNNRPHFDFSVDKASNSIHVTREFAAPLPKVWAAWTQKELLDQWWAPKPYRTETRELDFREGGCWRYAMVSPEGVAHWCRADYQHIHPEVSFSSQDAFTDAEGNINTGHPRSQWTNEFSSSSAGTVVRIVIRYESEAAMETIISMGFREGFTMGLGNLDELLASQQTAE